MIKIHELATAIKIIEGWHPVGHEKFPRGSLTYRFHNPGALRWSPQQVGTQAGFAVFIDDQTGMNALIWDLTCKAQGKTRTKLTPESTLAEFAAVWAPASDNNDPAAYANKIEELTKFPKTMKLKELLTEN